MKQATVIFVVALALGFSASVLNAQVQVRFANDFSNLNDAMLLRCNNNTVEMMTALDETINERLAKEEDRQAFRTALLNKLAIRIPDEALTKEQVILLEAVKRELESIFVDGGATFDQMLAEAEVKLKEQPRAEPEAEVGAAVEPRR